METNQNLAKPKEPTKEVPAPEIEKLIDPRLEARRTLKYPWPISLKNLATRSLKERFNVQNAADRVRLLEEATQPPWASWFKILLAKVLKSTFPANNAELIVDHLEQAYPINVDKLFELPLEEKAKLLGHFAAMRDIALDPKAPGIAPDAKQQLLPILMELVTTVTKSHDGNLQTRKISVEQFIAETVFDPQLGFADKGKRLNAFAKAYNTTVSPFGEWYGRTDASSFHLQILIHVMFWPIFGKPRSIAEMHRRMLSFSRKSNPNAQKREILAQIDLEKRMERRLQVICDRIGLRLRPQKFKSHAHK